MGARHPDYRRVKVHRTYTLAELASLFDVHTNTVRNWRRKGLQPIDDKRPALFHGASVRAILRARRTSAKQPCGLGRIYCLPCRSPMVPAGGMVDYQSMTATGGKLVGICPGCSRLIFRRVTLAQLPAVAVELDIQFSEAQPCLGVG